MRFFNRFTESVKTCALSQAVCIYLLASGLSDNLHDWRSYLWSAPLATGIIAFILDASDLVFPYPGKTQRVHQWVPVAMNLVMSRIEQGLADPADAGYLDGMAERRLC
jgi:hypothetical protein